MGTISDDGEINAGIRIEAKEEKIEEKHSPDELFGLNAYRAYRGRNADAYAHFEFVSGDQANRNKVFHCLLCDPDQARRRVMAGGSGVSNLKRHLATWHGFHNEYTKTIKNKDFNKKATTIATLSTNKSRKRRIVVNRVDEVNADAEHKKSKNNRHLVDDRSDNLSSSSHLPKLEQNTILQQGPSTSASSLLNTHGEVVKDTTTVECKVEPSVDDQNGQSSSSELSLMNNLPDHTKHETSITQQPNLASSLLLRLKRTLLATPNALKELIQTDVNLMCEVLKFEESTVAY